MWFKVKISRDIEVKSKVKTVYEVFLCDCENFAEAGYKVMQRYGGDCEIEDVTLQKSLKPAANDKYSDDNKVFIVKIAEDYVQDDGSKKTMKYPIPFFASNTDELQNAISFYMSQGLQNMRVTTISETKWEII